MTQNIYSLLTTKNMLILVDYIVNYLLSFGLWMLTIVTPKIMSCYKMNGINKCAKNMLILIDYFC